LVFFKRASQNCVRWCAPLTLLFACFLLWLAPTLAIAQQTPQVIEDIQVVGNRRIPKESITSRIYTRPGDIYDAAALERDLQSVWNTGYFDDVRIEREQGKKGWIINFYVREKPTIRTIDYKGLNSVSQSDVLDRYKKLKVGLTVDSPYDPTKVIKAKVALQDLLAEHGRQFANITVQVQQIPPAAVSVTFNVKEGPKIKVGKITFQGNKHVSSRKLRAAMKNLKPLGIPSSIFLENIFSRTFDASKLEEDAERVRDALQHAGYFKAVVEDPKTNLRTINGGFHIPVIQKRPAKVMDITIPLEEGYKYKLKAITFRNASGFLPEARLRTLFPIKDGETFDTHLLGKGIENMRKAYGAYGYVNFNEIPSFDIDDEKKLITVTIDIDPGKPYYVRRIEFQGNTTTRDRVIRRELLVQEGQIFNSQAWDLSILRLNQLNYFEALKPEDDTVIKRDDQNGTVDLTVKVKEKSKNSIGLTGGVSGLEGSFIGLNYETNNFLGLGATLTVQANTGTLSRVLLFGFTQPYMFDRPLSMGFTVYNRKFDFDTARQESILLGQNINVPNSILNQLLNYNQSSTGFTGSLRYALHSFKSVGLAYSFDDTNINTFTDASRNLFQTVNFRSISGPNALKGIITSSVTPSFGYSTIDSPIRPHKGSSFFLSTEVAGLGGNVRFYRPVAAYTRWTPLYGQNTLGFRLQGSFIGGWGGTEAPPYQRFYMGGEADLRGFDVRTVSPYVFLSTVQNITLTNPDGSAVPIDPTNPRRGNIQVPIPVNNITLPGGDTQVVANTEYRIKVVGPVVIAPFADFGMDFVSLPSQLKIASDAVTQLNNTIFGCPGIGVNFQCTGGTPIPFAANLKPVPGTNYVPRLSTGLSLQVMLPIVQQPFQIYYAYNPLRLDTLVKSPSPITRSMFPAGAAGDFTFQQALSSLAPDFRLQEPRKTFRFTISTTF
jgi:outer membrane protein insertion porin family